VRTFRFAALCLSLLAAGPAAAAEQGGGASPATSLTFTGALGGGLEIGKNENTGLSELELGLGYDFGEIRPEVAVLVGLSPGEYAGIRPGIHVRLPDGPFYVRAALDWAHQGGDWHFRWLFGGVGLDLRLTSVLGVFVEGDAGVPLTEARGVALLARGGFAFRF
jgi:hypothetical protein